MVAAGTPDAPRTPQQVANFFTSLPQADNIHAFESREFIEAAEHVTGEEARAWFRPGGKAGLRQVPLLIRRIRPGAVSYYFAMRSAWRMTCAHFRTPGGGQICRTTRVFPVLVLISVDMKKG